MSMQQPPRKNARASYSNAAASVRSNGHRGHVEEESSFTDFGKVHKLFPEDDELEASMMNQTLANQTLQYQQNTRRRAP